MLRALRGYRELRCSEGCTHTTGQLYAHIPNLGKDPPMAATLDINPWLAFALMLATLYIIHCATRRGGGGDS